MYHTWEDFDEIFNCNSEAPQQLTCEDLAPTIPDNFISQVVELTISLPQKCKEYLKLNITEKVDIYKGLFELFKKTYNATEGSYEIEYHQNGQPHLHGYVKLYLHPNIFRYDVKYILTMFAKTIFLELPQSCYKQLQKAEVNSYIQRFKSPAVTLSLKDMLATGWVNYMTKDARK